jgi:hypothetical protein
MAVVSYHQFVDGITVTDSSITIPYVVITDSFDTSPYDVVWTSGIPKVGDTFPGQTIYRILQGGVSGSRSATNQYHWDITVTYTSTGLSIIGGAADRIVSFSVDTRVYTRQAERAYELEYREGGTTTAIGTPSTIPDKKIVNSVDDPPNPGLQEEYYHQDATDLQGTLNSSPVTVVGIPIETGKGLLRRVNPIMSTDEDGEFEWRCAYQIEIAEVDHWLNFLNAGFNFLDADDSDNKRAVLYKDLDNPPDDEEEALKEVTDPVALDTDGYILSASSTPVFVYARTRPFANWNQGLDLESGKIRG